MPSSLFLITKLSIFPCYVGPLSSRHGSSSDCVWRRRPPAIKSNCEYVEEAAAESRQGVNIQLRAWEWG
jgi:hypothetical protein